MKYEIVRDQDGTHTRHPDQPTPGFLTATDALWWLEDRGLDASWYIRPVEASNG